MLIVCHCTGATRQLQRLLAALLRCAPQQTDVDGLLLQWVEVGRGSAHPIDETNPRSQIYPDATLGRFKHDRGFRVCRNLYEPSSIMNDSDDSYYICHKIKFAMK